MAAGPLEPTTIEHAGDGVVLTVPAGRAVELVLVRLRFSRPDSGPGPSSLRPNTSMPSATILTALTMSPAPSSLDTNPDAPARRATADEQDGLAA